MTLDELEWQPANFYESIGTLRGCTDARNYFAVGKLRDQNAYHVGISGVEIVCVDALTAQCLLNDFLSSHPRETAPPGHST